MKTIKSNDRHFSKKSTKEQTNNYFKEGILVRLLEKYKPKNVYDIQFTKNRKNNKKVA